MPLCIEDSDMQMDMHALDCCGRHSSMLPADILMRSIATPAEHVAAR